MPSLDLLRSLTDEHVLRALMGQRRLTRAELAAQTGISKPTVSESVRRLCAAGLVADTGERTTGRGRVGSYYALAREVGCALVLGVAPEGIHAEVLDAHGDVVAAANGSVERPARPGQVLDVLTAVARRAVADAARRVRLAVMSAADPVDRDTGRLVHLPDAPFLIGELAPAEVLAELVEGSVLVDNDVNWAARAERTAADARLDDFVYLYLGEGLGCAVVNDGIVRRGHAGLVGEIAHVITVGPGDRAVPFTEVFEALGVRHPGSTAIDDEALLAAIRADDREARATVSEAVCGVLAALVALADPEVVVIGGTWGNDPIVLDAVATRFADAPRHVPVRPARLTEQAALNGARTHALDALRADIANLG